MLDIGDKTHIQVRAVISVIAIYVVIRPSVSLVIA